MLGFGGGANRVEIAEDLTISEANIESVTDIHIQNMWRFEIDPFNANRIIALYRDDGTYGNDCQVVCGTIAADKNSVAWGTVVEWHAYYPDNMDFAWDHATEGSFIITGAVRGTGTAYHEARAGTVDSGTTITLGSAVDLSYAGSRDNPQMQDVIFNPAQAGQVIALNHRFNNLGSANYRCIDIKILTISGTTITHVNSQLAIDENCANSTISMDVGANNKGFISTNATSGYPSVWPFTMSGNTFSLGAKHIINSATCGEQIDSCSGELAGRVMCVYKDDNDFFVSVGNNDGGTITFGTAVKAFDNDTEGGVLISPFIECDLNTPGKFLSVCNINQTNPCRGVVGTIAGADTISYGTIVNILGGSTADIVQDIFRDPHNPGLIYTAHSHTGDSSNSKLVGSQLASFEL